MGRKKYTTEKFIELSKKVHKNKYDYSQSYYVDMHTKVKIICPKHGVFEILPYSHINLKVDCRKCSTIEGTKKRKIDFKEFVKTANEIYNGFYKYIKSSYIDISHKTTIQCPIHGKFEQSANSHINRGFECKKCAKEKRKLIKNNF